MPSLLAVAATDHPGGAEIGLLRFLRRLRHAGWDVLVTTPGPGAASHAAEQRGLRWCPLSLGGVRTRGAGTRAMGSYPAARRLARGHDVVYLNGAPCARVLPAVPRDRRVVLHLHEAVAGAPAAWRRADVVLADSEAVAAGLRDLAPVHVVGCPIEPEPSPVRPPWPPGDRPVVGYVGRIEPRKGALDFVHAAHRLRALGVRVVLVGEDEHVPDREYAGQLRSAPGVEHFGWVKGAAGLLGALDVLVGPSHEEPFGMVCAEALNAGTPVVATRVGGLPEVVEDGVTGRLVAPGDPEALTAAVADVLDHREAMGAAGRERARRWHADTYAERVARLIAPP